MAKQFVDTTIVAIATPIGNGGVGIIRISGGRAIEIVSKCFSNSQIIELEPRMATYGKFETPHFTDRVIAIYYPAPNSFTGEDVIEIHAHGGLFLLQKIVEHLVSLGATQATAGEFSRRAFLNGKMTLDQAEAIIETISAESEAHLAATGKIYQGKLRKKLFELEENLISCMARITASLDYPEHDTEADTVDSVDCCLRSTKAELKSLIDTAYEGRIITGGIQIAVLGKPNVGKSSLFNSILCRDRSIVTNAAGTTTDTISEPILYKGMKLVFNDTAGIRCGRFVMPGLDVSDITIKEEIPTYEFRIKDVRDDISEVELIGIERTKKVVADADVVLAIFDGSTPPDDEDEEILKLTKGKETIFVLNKYDLMKNNKSEHYKKFFDKKAYVIKTSALTGENVEKIKEHVYTLTTEQIMLGKTPASSDIVITNTRHLQELNNAYSSISGALTALKIMTLDCIMIDVENALNSVGNITGTRATEAIVDEIFSRFCIGK